MALILGLIGEKLAGKDTAADYLARRYEAYHVRHSQVLDDILRILDIPISRRNEIDLGMSLRSAFGRGVLIPAVTKRIKESTSEIIVLNGIRFQDELDNAKELGAKIIYVTAPSELRFKRFMERKEKADDATQTMEEFHAQESELTEIGIPGLGAKADFRIENTGTLEELHEKVDAALKTLS